MSKRTKRIKLAAYLSIGALLLYFAMDLIRSGNWWAIPFLMVGYGLLIVLTEISLLIYRILTTNFSLVIRRDMENSWIFQFSLGRVIFSSLLFLLKKWRGVAGAGTAAAAWKGIKNGASLQVLQQQPHTIKGSGGIVETSDKRIAIRRVGKT